MSLPRRFRALIFALVYGAWFVVSRHYFSILTAGVLAAFAVVVLSDDSFESSKEETSTAQAGADESSTASNWPRRERLMVLFYLVDDAAQREALAAAAHADRFAFSGPARPPDYVIYLIAGTKEEEVKTIERLNFEELLARQGGVDMRVIDARSRPQ